MAELAHNDVHNVSTTNLITSATNNLNTIPEKDVSEMKKMFEALLQEVLSKKNHNTQIMSKAAYMDMIKNIEKIKSMSCGKMPEDYARLRKYNVECYNGVKRLVDPRSQGKESKDVLQLVHTEEMFDIIHEAHLKTVHGGRNRMGQELRNYKNITRELITLYINTCFICEHKRRPRLTEQVERKSFFDFIEVPNDCDYKYILVHMDYNTKFLQLRPSKTKSVTEAAKNLMDIYTIFGPSISLFSSMGQEFCKKVIGELSTMWPEIKGTIKYPNDAVVRTNVLLYSVLEVLQARLKKMKTGKWVKILNIVQLTMNQTYKYDLKSSPYNFMFKGNILENKKNPRKLYSKVDTLEEIDDNPSCSHGEYLHEDVKIPSTFHHDIKIKEEIDVEMGDSPDIEMSNTTQDGITELKTEPHLETFDTESPLIKIEIEEDGWMSNLK